MIRRVTPSQFNSIVRQMQQKQRQALDKYKRAVRDVERKVNQYNQKVRVHNARVRADRQRLFNELTKMSHHRTTTTRYVTFRASVQTVHNAYERLESAATAGRYDDSYNEILDLSEREAANSAGTINALMGDALPADSAPPDSLDSPLTPILQGISADFSNRWLGALYSLNPRNPDAARHFCASMRELFSNILDTQAPDRRVLTEMPDCDRTPQGSPTRRTKIRFLLSLQGLHQEELETFIQSDMKNIMDLFEVFNAGTHGSSGTFDLPQLQAIRKRVEDALIFFSRLIH